MDPTREGKRSVTRALGYCRVSTEDQARNGHGLDAQRDTINAAAATRGWPVEMIADEGASGKRVNGGLRLALDHLATGRADALVVAKMDRLARSVLHASQIMEQARTQGWNLVICDLALDLSTPQGKAMASMLATFAELEREMIATRTREGLVAARARGKQVGRPPLVDASTVDRICRERDAGASFARIATALAADGVLSPEGRPAWQASTVRRILNRVSSPAPERVLT